LLSLLVTDNSGLKLSLFIFYYAFLKGLSFLKKQDMNNNVITKCI
jgi:hypothetical protein